MGYNYKAISNVSTFVEEKDLTKDRGETITEEVYEKLPAFIQNSFVKVVAKTNSESFDSTVEDDEKTPQTPSEDEKPKSITKQLRELDKKAWPNKSWKVETTKSFMSKWGIPFAAEDTEDVLLKKIDDFKQRVYAD